MVSLAGEVNLIDHEGKEYAQSVPHEKSQEERSHSAIQVDTSDSQDDRLDRPSAKDREDRVDGVRRLCRGARCSNGNRSIGTATQIDDA